MKLKDIISEDSNIRVNEKLNKIKLTSDKYSKNISKNKITNKAITGKTDKKLFKDEVLNALYQIKMRTNNKPFQKDNKKKKKYE
jgi:hypothetical protein